MFTLQDLSNSSCLALSKLANPRIRVDSGLCDNLLGARETNSVDIGKRVLNSFIAWKIHTCYTCQTGPPLALSLLVLGIDADHTYYAFPLDYFALLANLFYGSSYFHVVSILAEFAYSGKLAGLLYTLNAPNGCVWVVAAAYFVLRLISVSNTASLQVIR